MKYWRLATLVLLAVCAMLVSFLAKYKGSSDEAWGRYQTQVGITETNERLYEEERVEYEERMAILRGMVDSSNTIISEKEEDIAGKEAQIEDLERLRPLLSDKDSIIANLDQQIGVYKKTVADFKLIVAEKDKQIFSLTEQVKLTGQRLLKSEALYADEKALRQSAEQGWSLDRSRVSILRRQGRLSRSVAVGSLTAVGVAQIKGATALGSLTSGLVTSVLTYLLWK